MPHLPAQWPSILQFLVGLVLVGLCQTRLAGAWTTRCMLAKKTVNDLRPTILQFTVAARIVFVVTMCCGFGGRLSHVGEQASC